jgi:hypothetical protein
MNTTQDIDFPKLQAFQPGNSTYTLQKKYPSEFQPNYMPQSDLDNGNHDYQNSHGGQNQQGLNQYAHYYQYQSSYYDPFQNSNTPFSTKFPRAKDYNNIKSITETFPTLEKINDPNFAVENISPDAHFYILRSSNDDNIHKAIKYQIWSSPPANKALLRKAWQEFEDKKEAPEIYLIFTVVSSNQFLGVAKMASNIKDNSTFKYWWEPCKWFGTFDLQWVFIKDIHHSKFENIKEENTPVINLRDGTKISAKVGKQLLNIFKNHPNKPSIFECFDYMDRREDYIRYQRDTDPEFATYFAECCQKYQEDPETVFFQKSQYYVKKNNYRKPMNGYRKQYNNTFYPKNNYNNSYYNNNNTRNETPKQPVNIFEQFTVRTEGDKPNKRQNHYKGKKGKKNFNGNGQNEFLESGKDQNGFKGYHEEEEEDEHKNVLNGNTA